MDFTILEARRFISTEKTHAHRVVKDYEIDMEFSTGRIYSYDSIQEHRLSYGDVLVRKPHGVVSAIGFQNTYLLTLDFSNTIHQDMYSRNNQITFQEICEHESILQLESIIHPTHTEDVIDIYQNIIALPDKNSSIAKDLVRQLIYTLNAEILKKNYQLLKPKKTISETLLTYLQENLNRNITLDELSKLVHREKSYLIRVFKNETGKTPIEALTEMRLSMANDLIATSDLSINEIAAQSGYNTVSFFISKYKERYGITPEEHRRVITRK